MQNETNLDPELRLMWDRYNEILAAVNQGQISADTATAHVASMTTTDSADVLWGLTPQRIWWSQAPGQARMENADPSMFARYIPSFGTPDPADAFGPGTAAAPMPRGFTSDAGQVLGDTSGFAEAPQSFGMPTITDTAHYAGGSSQPGPARNLSDLGDDDEPAAKRKLSAPKLPSGVKLPDLSGLAAKLPGGKRTAIIAVVVLAIVAAAFMFKPSSAPAPAPGGAASTSAPAPADAKSPDAATVSRTIEAVKAGRFADTVAGDRGPVLSQSAWAGAGSVGLVVTPQAADVAGAQVWTVTAADGTAVKTVTVQWVNTAGTWKIAALPALAG